MIFGRQMTPQLYHLIREEKSKFAPTSSRIHESTYIPQFNSISPLFIRIPKKHENDINNLNKYQTSKGKCR